MMKPLDDNAQRQNGTLPANPFADAVPFEPPPPPDSVAQPRARKSSPRQTVAANDGRVGESSAPTFLRGDHVELGEHLVRRLAPAGELVFAEGYPWRYNSENGLWGRVDRSEESCIVQDFAGAPVGPKEDKLEISASDVGGAIKLAHDRVSQAEFFTNGSKGLSFSNGFLRVSADGPILLEHDPTHCARVGYPFPYLPGQPPRRFLKFLDDLFRDDDDRAARGLFIQEFFGACLVGIATTYEKCIIANGKGSNGKSRLANVIVRCMPKGTTSAIPPQDFAQEYRRAMLVGKYLNAVMELPESDILASESLKAIISGDMIQGRVIREMPVDFRPVAGHYYAANRMPGSNDQTEGFWRRFVVLTFNRSFENDPQKDPLIAEKIVAEELPELVAWLVDGAVRLMRQGRYTIPSSCAKSLAEWRYNSDQVSMFRASDLRDLGPEVSEPEWTLGSKIYDAYVRWATANGHRTMASNKLAARMKDLGCGAQHTRSGNRYPVAILSSSERLRREQGYAEPGHAAA